MDVDVWADSIGLGRMRKKELCMERSWRADEMCCAAVLCFSGAEAISGDGYVKLERGHSQTEIVSLVDD